MNLLFLRKRLPKSIRLIYRIAKSIRTQGQFEGIIDTSKFENARFYHSREAMITKNFNGGSILEIGTDTGKFARFLLNLGNCESLSTIDVDYSNFTLDEHPKLVRLTGWTSEVLPKLTEKFDLIYIDAAHDFKSVTSDIENIQHLIKKGTIIVFNDFAHIDPFLGRYGVKSAAINFINSSTSTIIGLSFEKHGLYDIAIKVE